MSLGHVRAYVNTYCCCFAGYGLSSQNLRTGQLVVIYFTTISAQRVCEINCLNPLTPTFAIKHPVSDRVKPSFVIFDIRALWRS